MEYRKINWKDLVLKENYLLGLMFPEKGIVVFRVTQVEKYKYLYDRVLTEAGLTNLTADKWVDAIELKDSDGNNILEVKKERHIYHTFYGLSPGSMRTYLYYPKNQARGSIDVAPLVAKSDFGYVSGFDSPLNDPSIDTELFVPYHVYPAFAFYNPLTVAVDDPLVKFYGARYKVAVVDDPELLAAIVQRKYPIRLATLGGIDPFSYDPEDVWNIRPIPLGPRDPEEIKTFLL